MISYSMRRAPSACRTRQISKMLKSIHVSSEGNVAQVYHDEVIEFEYYVIQYTSWACLMQMKLLSITCGILQWWSRSKGL